MLGRQLKKLPGLSKQLKKASYSNAVAAEPMKNTTKFTPNDYRTAEEIVNNQTSMHLGKFYRISPEIKKQIFTGGGLPKKFETQVKTFTETCLMIRQPALEIIDYIRHTDFTRPTTRYVLYCDNGVGKSLTMAHVLHYGQQNDFMLVHVPWAPNWMKRPKETANSAVQEGFIDLPFDAAAWLMHFKSQNTKLLSTLDMKTSKDYVWSKRESTPAGSTLTELIEHGISRVKQKP